MTNINIDLAAKLDGSETHMIAILIDSWGDKLIIPMMADTNIEGAEYFTPCSECGNAVLDCNFNADSSHCDRCAKSDMSARILEFMSNCTAEDNTPCIDCSINDVCTKSIELPLRVVYACAWCHEEITEAMYYVKIDNIPYHAICNENRKSAMLDMALTQTLPEDIMNAKEKLAEAIVELESIKSELAKPERPDMVVIDSTTKVVVNTQLDKGDRLSIAMETAVTAFWDVIALSYPEANDCTYLMDNLEELLLPNVKHWIECNVPCQTPRGERLPEIYGLTYADTWHLWHSGEGCMLAITDNVAVGGQYNYLVVSTDCVAIYEDKFEDDTWMMEQLCSWEFGDNPCVLMNQIDEFLGGPCLWDTGKLFNDVMVIAHKVL